MFPAAGATAAAASQDAAPTAPSYAAVAAGGGELTARETASAVPLKPYRLPANLHATLGATAPFVPASIAVLDPAVADHLISRSDVWVHMCAEEYADVQAAFVNERFSLRFAAARAGKITFFRSPGVKSVFLFEKMGPKAFTPFAAKTLTVQSLSGEEQEDGPEVIRFTGPETMYMAMHTALEGLPHRKLSHPKDTVRAYEVMADETAKRKLAAVGLVEERRAVVSSRFQEHQVTMRPKRRLAPEELFQVAKTFSTATGALLKQGAIRLRFASQEEAQKATLRFKTDYHVILDVPPKKESSEAQTTWSPGMNLPEPKETWAIKSLNSRPPELFTEAAELLGLRIYKLPTFTLALVEAKNGAHLTTTRLSSVDKKFMGMTLDLLDRF